MVKPRIKEFEGYKFDKWIFRSVLAMIFFMLCIAWLSEGFGNAPKDLPIIRNIPMFNNYIFIECPEDAAGDCENPLYFARILTALQGGTWECPLGLEEECSTPTIAPGDSIGKGRGFFVQSFPLFAALFIIAGFFLNHLAHNKGWLKRQNTK